MEFTSKDFEVVMENVKRIEKEISKNIVGQNDVVRQVLMCILTGGNVLLEGVPGLGKTRLVKTLGKVLGIDFSRLQFTPDLMPADVVGTNIISKTEDENSNFRFQPGPIFSNIVLADEINRATPKTQSALLEAMQEETVTVAGKTHALPQPFFVLATQNPIEMEGTYPLPEAQMDRFLFKLNVPFPSNDELVDILTLTTQNTNPELEQVTNAKEILWMRQVVREIPIARAVMEYAVNILMATHPENENTFDFCKKYIRFGASPRGVQAIVNTAKVRAVLEGRYNVSFEDIKQVAIPALRHRVFLNFEAVSEGITTDYIIARVIENLEKQLY
jgi:MoxR-like ATPase